MTVYGYARISRRQQNIDRQIRNIMNEYQNAYIVSEAFTGTTTKRPEWDKLLKRIKAGDTIVFDSVSRMSRNAAEGIQTYFRLMDSGVKLVFLKEPYINTDTYKNSIQQMVDATGNEIADVYIDATNKVLKLLAERQIEIAFHQAQKEVDDLHQRTKEGIETARLNGKQIGRTPGKTVVTKKSILCKQIIQKHNRDFGGSLNDIECMKMCGISRNTYYSYKKAIRSEIA